MWLYVGVVAVRSSSPGHYLMLHSSLTTGKEECVVQWEKFWRRGEEGGEIGEGGEGGKSRGEGGEGRREE